MVQTLVLLFEQLLKCFDQSVRCLVGGVYDVSPNDASIL